MVKVVNKTTGKKYSVSANGYAVTDEDGNFIYRPSGSERRATHHNPVHWYGTPRKSKYPHGEYGGVRVK